MQRAAPDHRQAPFIILWEATRACDLACRHCRADAHAEPYPGELDAAEAGALLDRLAAGFGRPLVVITGGDPLKRSGLDDLIARGRRLGLRMAITPAATPLLTRDRLAALRDAGIDRVALSLDGADAATHDDFRQVTGTWERTVGMLRAARELGISTQINTSVGRHNEAQIEAIAALGAAVGIDLWSVFFLVPVGRAGAQALIDRDAHLAAWRRLAALALDPATPFAIKTTAAQPYYRILAEERERTGAAPPRHGGRGVNDGNGCMFISHVGDIQPSGFLAVAAGNVRRDDPVAVYRDHPLFRSLRDPAGFAGACGACAWNERCGGSRARAWAMTGDALAADPSCPYAQELEKKPCPSV